MDDGEPSYLFGAISLLRECHATMEGLFARFEEAGDAQARKKIAEAALYELKIHATIEDLVLRPELEPERAEPEEERLGVRSLTAELESMAGDEGRRDERFAALAENVRRHIRREESVFLARSERGRLPAAVALGALLLAAAGARAQDDRGGGRRPNPATSVNAIANGGATGAATPVETVIAPAPPVDAEPAPAPGAAAKPAKRRAVEPAGRKRPSDRALVKSLRDMIALDPRLPEGSRDVRVAASAGTVVLTGTVLDRGDEELIVEKAAEAAGGKNVVDLISVRPASPAP